jgi:hypothetical protein
MRTAHWIGLMFALGACNQGGGSMVMDSGRDAPAVIAGCDARIAAKQTSCGAPPELAGLYRNAWCSMSTNDAELGCFEALSCAQIETEIHAGNFPCIGAP